MKVFVYYNLHKKCWSVRYKGKVIAHLDRVTLRNAEFKVNELGRQRVLREGRKNVHAGVSGYLDGSRNPGLARLVTYNPYLGPRFFINYTGKLVRRADICHLGNKIVLI